MSRTRSEHANPFIGFMCIFSGRPQIRPQIVPEASPLFPFWFGGFPPKKVTPTRDCPGRSSAQGFVFDPRCGTTKARERRNRSPGWRNNLFRLWLGDGGQCDGNFPQNIEAFVESFASLRQFDPLTLGHPWLRSRGIIGLDELYWVHSPSQAQAKTWLRGRGSQVAPFSPARLVCPLQQAGAPWPARSAEDRQMAIFGQDGGVSCALVVFWYEGALGFFRLVRMRNFP